jgi:dUTP pyrophosphatase
LFNINIKVDREELRPFRAHRTDAGADLIAAEDTLLTKGQRVLVKTGVYAAIPEGFVGLLIPRSSLSKRNIIMTNSIGVIDSDYRGEIMASLMYMGELSHTHIDSNDRIVQLVIVPIVIPNFTVVDNLDDTVRSTGGFGSTGI